MDTQKRAGLAEITGRHLGPEDFERLVKMVDRWLDQARDKGYNEGFERGLGEGA